MLKWLEKLIEKIVTKKLQEFKDSIENQFKVAKEETVARAKDDIKNFVANEKTKLKEEVENQLQTHATKVKNSITDKVKEMIHKK